MAIINIDGPCGTWPLDTDVCADWDEMAAVTGRASTLAVANLYRLTGRQFGLCAATIRPCHTRDTTFLSTYNSGSTFPPGARTHLLAGHDVVPVPVNGSISAAHLACSSCWTDDRKRLALPYRAHAIDDVTIDGEVIPTSEFAIFDGNMLVWQSPDDRTFPSRQNLAAPDGDPGTWSVTFTHGRPPPLDAEIVVGIYACELAKHMSNLKCALPRTATRVVRQGITYEMVNEDFLLRGLVGHPDIDQFIVSVNPYRLARRASIASPELVFSGPKYPTWPAP